MVCCSCPAGLTGSLPERTIGPAGAVGREEGRRAVGALADLPRGLLHAGGAILVVWALSLPVAAPASGYRATTALPILRMGYGAAGSAQTLDPALVNESGAADLIALVDANLVHILPSGKVVPDLATWKVSKNGLVYTFTIRSNARFVNGHTVTAAEALFSLQRSIAPSMPAYVGPSYLGLIEGAAQYHAGRAKSLAGVKVLGRRVLQIRITKPVAFFLDTLAYPTGDVLDPSVVKGKPVGAPPYYLDNYLSTTCIGNQGAGPFSFVCRNRRSDLSSFSAGGQHCPQNCPIFTYTLAPNPHYYGRKPHIGLQVVSGPFPGAAVDAYRRYVGGKLDVSTLPAQYLGRWRGRSGEYREYPSSAVNFLTPNTHLAPFGNVHCRLAVAYAVDRVAIAHVLQDTVRPAYTVLPKGMLGYYPGKDNPHYSPARARAELAKCPSRAVPVELVYATFSSVANDEFAAISSMLQSIGMNVRLQPVSGHMWSRIVSASLDQTRSQLVQNGWAQDYPDPQDYCTLLLRSGQPLDIGGWHNATYDRLVDRGETERNRRARAQLYVRAQHIALSQGAWISLSYAVNQALVKPYVHGLIGSEAYDQLVPKDLDWSTVSIGRSPS